MLVLACVAACRTTSAPETVPGAPLAVQPPYALWWAATESCARVRGDLSAIKWATYTDGALVPSDQAGGNYDPARHQITLAPGNVLRGAVVRHEMLHALLRIRRGDPHPPEYFQQRCGGLVTCAGACASRSLPSAAPAPPGAPALRPSELRATIQVTPDDFPADSNGGWVLITVAVRNPLPRSAIVRLDTEEGAKDAIGFGYRLFRSGGPELLDGDTIALGPGETRRRVFDVSTAGLRPGAYIARAIFNTAPAESVYVTIRP